MSQKALLAVCIAVLLPVVSYFIVKSASDDAIVMPRRYYPDSVINKVVDGKSISDTIWHQVADFTLTNQLGKQVSLHDLKGKIIVADFFFATCPTVCPRLTAGMKKLQTTLKGRDELRNIDTSFVHFLSFTVDPERDSPSVLKAYADRFGADHDIWWFLTGPKKTIYNFSINELKLGLQDKAVDSNFIHSQRMVLLDKNHVVRGYYDGLDSTQVLKLAQDIIFLMLEKDKNQPSTIVAQLKPLWPIFIIVLIAVGIFVWVTRRSRKEPRVG